METLDTKKHLLLYQGIRFFDECLKETKVQDEFRNKVLSVLRTTNEYAFLAEILEMDFSVYREPSYKDLHALGIEISLLNDNQHFKELSLQFFMTLLFPELFFNRKGNDHDEKESEN